MAAILVDRQEAVVGFMTCLVNAVILIRNVCGLRSS